MATPGAPATVTAKRGPVPRSLYVTVAAVSASPAVTSYTVYIWSKTGVGKAATAYSVKRPGLSRPATTPLLVEGLPEYPTYFITATATNSEAEGSAATETSVKVIP